MTKNVRPHCHTLAKELFETKNSSVRDTAQTVGIEDEKYFSRLFKEYTGMTASEYRKTAGADIAIYLSKKA